MIERSVKEAMRDDYESGISLRKLGKMYYTDRNSIRKHILSVGGVMRNAKPEPKNWEMFINDWNAGHEVEHFMTVYGYRDANSVYDTVYYLRKKGRKLNWRKKGRLNEQKNTGS